MLTSNPTPSKRRGGNAAFTLIEVLMSSMITAVVFAALFYAIGQCMNIIQYNREDLRATQIMTGKIEAIRLCAWGSSTNVTQLFNTDIVPTNFVDYFYPVTLGGFSSNSVVYTGTITVQTNGPGSSQNFAWDVNGTTASPPSYSNAMAQITVTVNWSETHYGRTLNFSKSMRTYVAADGVQNYSYYH